jgi:hypothetical protein
MYPAFRTRFLVLPALAACLAVATAYAQPRSAAGEEPFDGLVLGRWLVSPSLSFVAEADDNIFRRNRADDVVADRYTRIQAALGATLPFRQSRLSLGYLASRLRYQDLPTPERDTEQEGSVELELQLSRGDTLTLSGLFNRGFNEVQQIDESGELVFEGRPFNYNRYDLRWERFVPAARGYLVHLTRRDLNFDSLQSVAFFDYRGYDAAVAFREPLGPTRWFELRYNGRRFDNFRADGSLPVGRAYRREVSDQAFVGLTGRIGRDKNYYVRAGYGRFRYELVPAPEFEGVVFQAGMAFIFRSARINIDAFRRPSASFFDSYLTTHQLRARYRYDWQTLSAGVEARLFANRYGSDVPCGTALCRREDDILFAETFAEYRLHPRVGMRLSLGHQDRAGNVSSLEYDTTFVRWALILGWLE